MCRNGEEKVTQFGRNGKNERKKMNKKIAIFGSIGLAFILIILAISFTFASTSIFKNEDEFRKLELSIDNKDIRKGDFFNITVTNLPKGANVTWDFGDGNTSNNQIGTHQYLLPGYYKIIVEGSWEGGYGNGSFDIGIKNKDYYNHQVNDAMFVLRRGVGTGNSDSYYFPPGISNPLLNLEIILRNAIGGIEYFIEVFTYYENDSKWDTVLSESTIATYETLTFQKEIDEIKIDPESEMIEVWAGFILWEGRIQENEITMEINF